MIDGLEGAIIGFIFGFGLGMMFSTRMIRAQLECRLRLLRNQT